MPTLLIVDDHPLVRCGLRDVLSSQQHFKIIGESANGDEALAAIPALKPDLVILDIDMPRRNGLETIRAIRELPVTVKIIILTMYKEEDMFNAAMDLGAKAYVLKENAAQDVLHALEKVDRGETFVSPLMQPAGKRRTDRVKQLLISKPQIELLTPSERRILKLVGEDLTSKEIADRLQLSVRTVE
ncbi:MAG TPA: response regulator transcription factor, partial [Verrucomicrobiae bacterium]